LIRVETDNGLTGIGSALSAPPIVTTPTVTAPTVTTIVEHELAAECV
jgi:hypothetical protein